MGERAGGETLFEEWKEKTKGVDYALAAAAEKKRTNASGFLAILPWESAPNERVCPADVGSRARARNWGRRQLVPACP
jgi:hypothetical protein